MNPLILFSFVFSVAAYFWITLTTPEGVLQTIKLQQLFALTAFIYLYIALLARPFCQTFPDVPFKKTFLQIRPSLIASAFYFGLLHGCISFFVQLGGFSGLSFLSNNYLLAIACSSTALLILFLLTLTSFTITKLTETSKLFSWLAYLAGILILIHALMLGTHFQTISDMIPQLFFIAFFMLLFLEAYQLDLYVLKKNSGTPRFGLGTLVVCTLFVLFMFTLFTGNSSVPSFNIHSQHIQLAKLAQDTNTQINLPPIPGLRGDRTKRFTVSFDHPDTVSANQDTTLSFRINDAASGNPVEFFEKVYEKPMHMIVVDSSLSYFTHIHPQQTIDGFSITTQFPKDAVYHIYIDFQPFGAIEQQFAFTLPVGNTGNEKATPKSSNTKTTKVFGAYEVTLQAPHPLQADKLSIGEDELSFTIRDAKTKKPMTTLKPYLAAFGHLVMINEKTYDYLHVHPTNLIAPKPNENGGPTVRFLPLGLYGPIKPGIYRVFAQFNPNNKLFTADFTVEIQ